MELAVFCLSLASVFEFSEAVWCYKCAPEREGNSSILCQDFNTNNEARFLFECKNSTMCYKKEVFTDFGNGNPISAVTRGCAPQTLRDHQKLVNHRWVYDYTIYEAYDEKCFVDTSDDERTTTNTFCYCRGNLCNSATINRQTIPLLAFICILFWLSFLAPRGLMLLVE